MAEPTSERRLDSWKAIAAYLERDVTTVRRWERSEGLPVHRHVHSKLGSVYAYPAEVDAWRAERRATPVPHPHEPEAGQPAVLVADPAGGSARGWLPPLLAVAGMSAAAVFAGLAFELTAPAVRDADDPGAVHVAVTPAPESEVDSLALSPDGEQIVFSASTPGTGRRLWLRRLDSVEGTPVASTEGATFPFWSPDGQSIGFFAGGKLNRIDLATRRVRELADAPDGRGGTWSADGIVLFAPDRDAPLFSVPAMGGATTRRTEPAHAPVGGHAWPEWLPDGRHFLFTDYTSDPNAYGIYVGDLETGACKRLVRTYSSAAYAPGGFLLYALYSADALVAHRFDPGRLEVVGDPIPLGELPYAHEGLGHKVDVATSQSGLLAFRGADELRQRLVWRDRSGRELGEVGNPGLLSNPVLSPDGRRAIVTVGASPSGSANLWTVDLETDSWARLTFTHGIDFAPLWSPDAAEILFASRREKQAGVYRRRADGRGPDELVFEQARRLEPDSWSAHGTHITFSALARDTRFDVWASRPGGGEPFPILQGPYNEGQSQVSPDGRFIAYASDESGRFEVYVRSFPELQDKWQVSSAGGADPRWRPDGKELFYVAADRRMMVLGVQGADSFGAGGARPLFDTGLANVWQDTRNHYDVSDDGTRFLILQPFVDTRALPFTVVVNWRRLLPAG